MTTVELLRHAVAVDREQWWGRPDRDRPLTRAGREQARAIAEVLTGADPLVALYSSSHLRCVDTLQPVAVATGLDIRTEDGLAEAASLPVLDGGNAWVASAWLAGRGLAFLARAVAKHPGGRVVACTHGDVASALMAALVGRDGIGLTDVRCPKGGWFTLTFDGPRCLGALAHRPPVPA